MPPQNRKQRRAAAAATAAENQGSSFDPSSSIPLARPPSTQRQGKTLLEIAAERQSELNQFVGDDNIKNNNNTTNSRDTKKGGQKKASLFDLNATETQFLEISPDGEVSSFDPASTTTKDKKQRDKNSSEEEEEEEEGIPPTIDTLLLSIPLTTVHLTLAFLAAHQYAQQIIFKNLLKESVYIAFPVLTFCIHLAHGHILSFSWTKKKSNKNKSKSKSNKQPQQPTISTALIGDLYTGKTAFFLSLAIVLGALLVRTTNEAGYYAVMKRAPSIGTMWVWCVLEISSPVAAALALLVPLAWAVVMGYAVY